MSNRYLIIRQLADGQFHSGEELAAKLGMSRAGVWKHLKALRDQFHMDIHSVSGRGYRLAQPLELLDQAQIISGLSHQAQSRISSLERYDSIDSTNAHLMAKALEGARSGAVCLAEQQTISGPARPGPPIRASAAEAAELRSDPSFLRDPIRVLVLLRSGA